MALFIGEPSYLYEVEINDNQLLLIVNCDKLIFPHLQANFMINQHRST